MICTGSHSGDTALHLGDTACCATHDSAGMFASERLWTMAHTYVPGQLHGGPLDGDIIEAPRRENHQFPEPVIRVPVPVLDAALVARDRDRPSHRAGNGHDGEMGIKGVRPTPASIRAAQAAANRSPASLRCSSQVRASARCPASLSILAASLAANEPATAAPGPPSRREFRLAVECQESSSSVTPLLGRVGWSATWANVVEHAADPPGYWGSRGREFKSRRPDRERTVQRADPQFWISPLVAGGA